MGDHAGRRYAARFIFEDGKIFHIPPPSAPFPLFCRLPTRAGSISFLPLIVKIFRTAPAHTMPRTHTDTRLCGAIGQTAPTHSRSGRPTHPKRSPTSHNAGTRASLRSSQHEHLRPARTPVRIRIRAGSSVASEPPLAVCIPQSAHVMAEIAPLCWRARSLAPLFPPPNSSQKTGIQCIFVARRAAAASCLSAPSWSDCPPPQPPCWDPARPPFGDAVAQSTPL